MIYTIKIKGIKLVQYERPWAKEHLTGDEKYWQRWNTDTCCQRVELHIAYLQYRHDYSTINSQLQFKEL